jgi:hypothetical protein
MYGVPTDLNLDFLLGATLTMIGLGEFDLQLHFDPEGYIHVEGGWALYGPDANPLDRSMSHSERTEYRLHILIGKSVTSWGTDPPRSFDLVFSDGSHLRVYDDSREYESFSIQPGDIVV